METAFRMAEVGLGCAIIPETVARFSKVPSPPLLFSFGDPITKWELAIAYREGTVLSNAALEFIHLAKNLPMPG